MHVLKGNYTKMCLFWALRVAFKHGWVMTVSGAAIHQPRKEKRRAATPLLIVWDWRESAQQLRWRRMVKGRKRAHQMCSFWHIKGQWKIQRGTINLCSISKKGSWMYVCFFFFMLFFPLFFFFFLFYFVRYWLNESSHLDTWFSQ